MLLRSRSVLMALGWMMVATTCGVAHGDVGGEVPAPGDCGYPFVGSQGLDGVGVYHYFCAGPTEINGSHWQVIYGGFGTQFVTFGVGVNIAMFNANASISPSGGVIEGISYWACPDLTQADEPNPIQTWQGASNATAPVPRSKCKTVGDYPARDLPALPGIPPPPPVPGPPT